MNVPFRQDMRFQSYGAFGELTYQLNPQNKIVTGARVDQVTVDDERADSKAKGFNTQLEKPYQVLLSVWKIKMPSMV
jgi:iron complex outermembrane receptor protein